MECATNRVARQANKEGLPERGEHRQQETPGQPAGVFTDEPAVATREFEHRRAVGERSAPEQPLRRQRPSTAIADRAVPRSTGRPPDLRYELRSTRCSPCGRSRTVKRKIGKQSGWEKGVTEV